MGVPQYTWATSPLRLCGPGQPVADHLPARHGKTAALVAPFKQDAQLFSIISGFRLPMRPTTASGTALTARWTLLACSRGLTEPTASVMKEAWCAPTPMVFKALGCEPAARRPVRVRITGIDEMTLDVHANLIERLDAAALDDSAEDDGEGSKPPRR